MPGMLNTKLNVPFTELKGAVIAVWDSWNSDHAKQYRAEHKISDDIGTAVIIQMMARNLRFSGVAFTNSPTNVDEPEKYAPVIEYVEGTGDGLVGGEVEPSVAEEGGDIFKNVHYYLKLIHRAYGPSDTEWCISSGGSVYFVQQRALKFTAAKVEAPDDDGRVFIAKGRSIGATCKVTARVLEASKLTKAADIGPGDAVYVSCFMPEYYSLMTAGAAIITKVGGETCHAAIIARELNRPAISGIPVLAMDAVLKAGKVVIDGGSGKIYAALEGDEHTVIAKIKMVEDVYRTPDFSLVSKGMHKPYQINKILHRFYVTLDNYRKGLCTIERKNEVVGEIAGILCMYLYIATICETRHLRGKCKQSKVRRTTLAVLKRLGVEVPSGNGGDNNNRVKYSTTIPQPANLRQAIAVNKWITRGFFTCGWGGSYGGKKWGKIGEVLGQYLRGELSHAMFVDSTFNLKHNGNFAFDKFDWLQCQTDNLKSQLDAKVRGVENLKKASTFYFSPGELENYTNQKSIIYNSHEPYKHFMTPKE
jgi:phosphohistidine swiveling domain-containing protein